MRNHQTPEELEASISKATHLPPIMRDDTRRVQGYVMLHVKDCDTFEPRGTCRWAHCILRDGETVVNRNVLDDWTRNDPEFAARLEDGRITVGAPTDPVATCNDIHKATGSARERYLEAELVEMRAELRRISSLVETATAPEKGKKS